MRSFQKRIKMDELLKDICQKAGYDVHEDSISVPKDTPDNEIIQEVRKLGYVIQYKLL